MIQFTWPGHIHFDWVIVVGLAAAGFLFFHQQDHELTGYRDGRPVYRHRASIIAILALAGVSAIIWLHATGRI